jgi:hypothetical protein
LRLSSATRFGAPQPDRRARPETPARYTRGQRRR